MTTATATRLTHVNFSFDRDRFDAGYGENMFRLQEPTNKVIASLSLTKALQLRDAITAKVDEAAAFMAKLQERYAFDYTKLYEAICAKAEDHLVIEDGAVVASVRQGEVHPLVGPNSAKLYEGWHLRGPFGEMGLGYDYDWRPIRSGETPPALDMLRMMAWLDDASWTEFLTDEQTARMLGGGSINSFWS